MLPPVCFLDRPASLIPTKLVFSGVNRVRSPIFTGKWLRDGIHLVTGASSGEISLWNPIKYIHELNFPAHESAIRTIGVSHDGQWIISADHNGQVKYWQPNLNLVHTLVAHSDPIRGISFSPSDLKFASCSDDGLIKIWDFERYKCVATMQGHGTDVKCLDWHPMKGLIVSGSKDCQQPIMLWDPRSSSALCTIHIHKNAIMSVSWNCSGNFFASASKDKTLKIFDIRTMKEFQVLRGHKKEPYNVTWHPLSDQLLSSGSVDGTIIHWLVGEEKELSLIEGAHDGVIWELSWHPEGHIFSSVSNDQATKIWIRSGPQRIEPVDTPPNISERLATHEQSHSPLKDTLELDTFEPNNILPVTESSLMSRYSYPPPRHRLFRCIPYIKKSQHTTINKYPIATTPKATISSEKEAEMEFEYVFSPSIELRHVEQFEYENVYDEEDEVVPVTFPQSQFNLNFIHPQTVEHIYRNFYTSQPVSQPFQYHESDPNFINIATVNPIYGGQPILGPHMKLHPDFEIRPHNDPR